MSAPAVDPTDTLAVLKAAEEWLSDPEHWTQGVYWRGKRHDVGRRESVQCTCVMGALSYVSGSDVDMEAPEAAADALYEAFDGIPLHVNDGPNGYECIMAGLRRAIEKLEAGQS